MATIDQALEIASSEGFFVKFAESAKADSRVKLNGMRLCISAGAILPADLNKGFEEYGVGIRGLAMNSVCRLSRDTLLNI